MSKEVLTEVTDAILDHYRTGDTIRISEANLLAIAGFAGCPDNATAYAAIDMLVDMGIITPVELNQGTTYQLVPTHPEEIL